ncbi:uncharacterized protein [Parasteatoda tepidariorum]|uniref:uncharacterized protein n=1 Tax=Parasteatoda tepidariorum TaxID=114398 RepID=UPI00077F8E16|nr:uncharacterized protein LOC107449590 [Parasteatoda tepidariorum]
MEMSNGPPIMESEEAKKEILNSLFQTINVAKEHYKDLVKTTQTVYPGFEFGHYDVHHLPFLKIDKSIEEADLWSIIQLLRKYSAVLNHMTQGEQLEEEYRLSIMQARWNIDQLVDYATFMARIMEEKDVTDEGPLVLPDELKLASSPSKRQRRDILTIRDYGKLLCYIENVLMQYNV